MSEVETGSFTVADLSCEEACNSVLLQDASKGGPAGGVLTRLHPLGDEFPWDLDDAAGEVSDNGRDRNAEGFGGKFVQQLVLVERDGKRKKNTLIDRLDSSSKVWIGNKTSGNDVREPGKCAFLGAQQIQSSFWVKAFWMPWTLRSLEVS